MTTRAIGSSPDVTLGVIGARTKPATGENAGGWAAPGGWVKEGSDLVRAFSGALLYGIPLLSTMELWRVSSNVPFWELLLFLVVAFAAKLALSYFIGFRPRRPSAANAVTQEIESVAGASSGRWPAWPRSAETATTSRSPAC